MSHCPGSMNQRAKEIVDITTGQTEETKKALSRAKVVKHEPQSYPLHVRKRCCSVGLVFEVPICSNHAIYTDDRLNVYLILVHSLMSVS